MIVNPRQSEEETGIDELPCRQSDEERVAVERKTGQRLSPSIRLVFETIFVLL